MTSETSQQKLWQSLMDQMQDRLNQAATALEESRKRLYEDESEKGISTAFGPLLTGGGTSMGGGNQYMIPDIPQIVAQLKTDIIQKEVELDALKESFAASDPNVIKLERQIEASKRKLQQETDKALEKYNKQFGLTRVAAEVVFNQQLYSSLVTKQEELKAQHLMQNQAPEIVEEAIKPIYPSGPNRTLTLMMGAAMGMFLGLGLALFREYMDNSMHKAEDMQEAIGIPVLGKIPRLSRAIYAFGRSKPDKRELIDHEDSSRRGRIKEIYKEAYRMLQLEMMAAISKGTGGNNGNARSHNKLALLVTSSIAGEGKSVVAANLAISIAQTGKKVLLVDADSHSSVNRELLDMDSKTGLIDVLMGNADWEASAVKTRLENLYAIATGDGNGQSDLSSLLISSRLEEIIDLWRNQFDVVIFNSSPAISTSESAAIGSKVDGVIIVIEANKTQRDAILQAKQRIQNAGGNILGAVLNHMAIEKKYYKA